eukprot:PhF_6_TR27906/c0_g2_i3/m.40938/K03163/TOP1; DNA topoisomerase I
MHSMSHSKSTQWTSLVHHGVFFPPPYEPHNIPIVFIPTSTSIQLNPIAEEMITNYVTHKICHPDNADMQRYEAKFFETWVMELDTEQQCNIQNLEQCNFDAIKQYVTSTLSKRLGQRVRQNWCCFDAGPCDHNKYETCLVDGVESPVSGYHIELPGFCTSSSLQLKYRRRVMPEDVTINCGVNDAPPPPPAGHHWKEVIHDPTVWWIAKWKNVDDVDQSAIAEQSTRQPYGDDVDEYDVDEHKTKQTHKSDDVGICEESGAAPSHTFLLRALTVLSLVEHDSFVCPTDVNWEIIDSYTHFDIRTCRKSHAIRHPNMKWPLGMTILLNRYLLVADSEQRCLHLHDMQHNAKYIGNIAVHRPNFVTSRGRYVAVTANEDEGDSCTVYAVDYDITTFDYVTNFNWNSLGGLIFLDDDNILICSQNNVIVFTISSGERVKHSVKATNTHGFCDICPHPVNPDLVLISCFNSDCVVVLSRLTFQCVEVIHVTSNQLRPGLGLNGIVRLSESQVVVMCMMSSQLLLIEGDWGSTSSGSKTVTILPSFSGIRLCYHDFQLLIAASDPPSFVVYR